MKTLIDRKIKLRKPLEKLNKIQRDEKQRQFRAPFQEVQQLSNEARSHQ